MMRIREYAKVELVETGIVKSSHNPVIVVDDKDDENDNSTHRLCVMIHHHKICLLASLLFLAAAGIMTALSVSSDTCFYRRRMAEPLSNDAQPTDRRRFLLHMHGDSLLADPDWKQMVTIVDTYLHTNPFS